MSCIFEGFNESSGFFWDLDPNNGMGPGGNYYSLNININHDIPIKKIPGKGKRHITMRTSDIKTPSTGPLLDSIEMVVYCVREEEHLKAQQLAYLGGPFHVTWPYDPAQTDLYCISANFSQEFGFPAPPDMYHDNMTDEENGKAFYCKWTFKLIEYNKGI